MSDEIERVARAMFAVSRPTSNPDDLTPIPRGAVGLMPKWRLFEYLAEAAVREMAATRAPSPDMAEAVGVIRELETNNRQATTGQQVPGAWDRARAFLARAGGEQ